jgi:perosamine synthetase
MITTGNGEWAERMKILRLHGISSDAWRRYTNAGSWYYEVVESGHKYNLTDIQAGIGIAQLGKIDWMWNKRKEIADRYTSAFCNNDAIIPPSSITGRETAWNLYVIKLNLDALTIDRNRFIEEMKKRGIGTSVHFIPLHRHPFYRENYDYANDDFPEAEWVFERIISLPIYPGLKDDEIERVAETVLEIAKRFRR